MGIGFGNSFFLCLIADDIASYFCFNAKPCMGFSITIKKLVALFK